MLDSDLGKVDRDNREREPRWRDHELAQRIRSRSLVSLETLVSLSGVGGGTYLAAHPLTAMPVRYLQGTWFHTWRWPGFALFVLVGLCPAVAAIIEGRRLRIAPAGHLCVGVGLVAWVTLEAAWVVTSAGLQVAFGVIGAAIAYLGYRDLVDRRRLPRRGGDGGS